MSNRIDNPTYETFKNMAKPYGKGIGSAKSRNMNKAMIEDNINNIWKYNRRARERRMNRMTTVSEIDKNKMWISICRYSPARLDKELFFAEEALDANDDATIVWRELLAKRISEKRERKMAS